MHVVDSSIQLSVPQRPTLTAATAAGGFRMDSTAFQVTARCRIEDGGAASSTSAFTNPRLAPWKVGFMQLQVLEVSWAYFRGVGSSDGCVLNDKVARRTDTVCRDYEPGAGVVWYEGSARPAECYGVPDPGKPGPWDVEFYYGDRPEHDVPLRVTNAQTSRANYLYEARGSMAFLTTLTEEVSTGSFRHLRHFFWSVIWHVRARGGGGPNAAFDLLPGSGFWMSPFKIGGPSNGRYLAVLNDPGLRSSCNDIAQSVSVDQSTASGWQRFPLMDKKDALF